MSALRIEDMAPLTLHAPRTGPDGEFLFVNANVFLTGAAKTV